MFKKHVEHNIDCMSLTLPMRPILIFTTVPLSAPPFLMPMTSMKLVLFSRMIQMEAVLIRHPFAVNFLMIGAKTKSVFKNTEMNATFLTFHSLVAIFIVAHS